MSKKLLCLYFVLFLVGFPLIEHAFAQVPPPPITPDQTATDSIHFQQNWDRYRIERQIQQATTPMPGIQVISPQLPPPEMDGKSQEKIFKLNQVLFDPMPRSIPWAELDAVTSRYIALEAVSIYDLYNMIIDIDALFDKRQVLGRAGLPVQDVESGIITVQIIEGRETRRTITTKVPSYCDYNGTGSMLYAYRWFGSSFVQRQFRFYGNPTFNMQQLEDELLRFNRTYRSQLTAEIEPGNDLGQCTLKLTRTFQRPISGGYYVDNSGRETSGRIRNGVYANLTDVLGANDSFFISYDKTEGTSSLYMQGDIPVSRFGTFFDMSWYYGEPKTISGPAAVLNINGISEQYRPGFRHILVHTKEHRLDTTLHFQNYDSQTFFDTSLNYAEKHDAWTVGLEYSRQREKTALFAGLSVVAGNARTLGPPLGEFVGNHFSLMKLNLMKIWYPNSKWTYILRGNGSMSMSSLPQSQFFQIGGMTTVRGTPEALLSGDSGYLIVAEARRLIWSNQCNYYRSGWRRLQSRAELFTFMDHGGVFSRGPVSDEFLTSLGAGVTAQLGKHCTLMGGYGQPIFTSSASDWYRDKLRNGNAFFTARVTF